MILFDAGKGSIFKVDENSYKVSFYLNGKQVTIGTYPTKELAEEVRQYFISINYDLDKFKESKYWKELRNVGANSEEKRGQGSISKLDENSYIVSFFSSGKHVNIGVYTSKELAEEVRKYFISINYDLDKFKESKYWKELRKIGPQSEEKKGKGSIYKTDENTYQVQFRLKGQFINVGIYPSKELAEEARKYFISINYDLDKFKESKYWKELRNVGANSEEKRGQGSIFKIGEYSYQVQFGLKGQLIDVGKYSSKELAEEVRKYFISINYDLDKFKESKYWTERSDNRQTSKNYWNHITMNKKNTSGVTGVSLDYPRFLKGKACWKSQITINYKQITTRFYSKEAAIQYRLELEQLGHTFNENHDQKRREEQMKYIEERARNMEEEKTAKLAAEAYRKGLENPDGEDTTTWDSINDDDILDSISYVEQSSQAPNNFSGKYYQIKINETGELVDVYERDGEIALYLANKDKELPYSRFSSFLNGAIGKVGIDGKELERLAVNSNYQGYKLGDFLVKKAVEDYGCEYVVCNGTRAYRLYRKYGFIPYTIYSKGKIEENGGPYSIITLYQHPKEYQQWYIDYCDKYYKGQIDSKPKKRKIIMQVGDSIEFKDGRIGIVEDYDDKYYYVKDNNTKIIKILKS